MRETEPDRSAEAPSRRGRLGFVITACLASAGLLAPIAIGATGSALREGVRNPSSGGASKETQIIARTDKNVYGTRQSNVGRGGSAIYGCRSDADFQRLADPAVSTPCLRVNNLASGLVYSYRFAARGVGGVFQAGLTPANDPTARPFITNATAVATGLNADRLDGIESEALIATIRADGPGGAGPKGPTGDAGPTGPAGTPGLSGLDCDPNATPECRGPSGERGLKWFTGDPPPPGNLAGTQQGDFYLDVSGAGEGDVYEKTGPSTWTPRVNIKGPDSDDGGSQFVYDALVRDYCNQNPTPCTNPPPP